MSHTDTLAVLRDVFIVAMLSLGAAIGLYKALRHWSDRPWNLEGNVLVRPFGGSDLVAALLLLFVFGSIFFPAGMARSVPADAEAVAEVSLSSLLGHTVGMLFICCMVLSHMIALRGLNPGEMFGLRQMSVKRALMHAVRALGVTIGGMWLVLAAVVAVNGSNLPDTSSQEIVQSFEKSQSLAFRILLGLTAVITAPLTEELLFRGFLYGIVKRYTERWFAAVFTSVMFSVVHLHVGTAPQLFILGLGLAIAYEHTGCLLVPVFMHALFNAWNISVLTYLSATAL
ncbi:MAG: CPBP family intramembrane glutamic endopeptidase [Roseimicrobium sp.]